MNKMLAIINREYLQRLRTKAFIIATALGPLLLIGFSAVPALVIGIKTGQATRITIVDQTGRMYESVRENILTESSDEDDEPSAQKKIAARAANANRVERVRAASADAEFHYEVEQVAPDGRSLDDVKRELNRRVLQDELDAYIIIPPDILTTGKAEYFGRNVGDVFTIGQLEDHVTNAVIAERMNDAQVDPKHIRELSRRVNLEAIKISERGEERDSGGSFMLAFIVGFFIYMTVTLYGQAILSAVVEEKSTRIAEVLFSSVRAFPLIMGKLIGISLLALTQYAIWGLALAGFALYGVSALVAQGIDISLPRIAPSTIIYFFLFFLLGYFVYATIFVLVGAMVTTTQEGGQASMPVMLLFLVGFYLAFPVIRSPHSSFSFWVSMVPFFAPVTMVVRIVTETPPLWEIALSLLIGVITVVLFIWIAARVYRTGMLMYGKRASIPEVLRWIRQP